VWRIREQSEPTKNAMKDRLKLENDTIIIINSSKIKTEWKKERGKERKYQVGSKSRTKSSVTFQRHGKYE